LHLQNFGSFRGANRLVYFDLNDFDEAGRLPVCLDLLRLLGSVLTAAPGLGVTKASALSLVRQTVQAYARALARGKAFWLERDTAVGPINTLLKQTEQRRRRDLLATRTHLDGTQRRMNNDGTRYLSVAHQATVCKQIAGALKQLAIRYGEADFFELRDIAFRVAGMGSLGVERYVALVRGKGDPGRNALIDFKHAVPSAATAAWPQFAQPSWSSEAERVAAIQDLCQVASPAFLSAMSLGDMPVVARELQPVEDKIALAPLAHRLDRFGETLEAMAHLSAYAQLRSAGRAGAAGADELIGFGSELLARPDPWVAAARAVDAANAAAYAKFQAAWREGDPRLHRLAAPDGAAPPSGAQAQAGAKTTSVRRAKTSAGAKAPARKRLRAAR
jgi:uncharacterized protein (DUF2252 family)